MTLNQLTQELQNFGLESPDSSPYYNSQYSSSAPIPYFKSDVRYLPRSRRGLQISENGTTLPTVITLPLPTAPKTTIIEFGNQLGITMPVSHTRVQLVERIRQHLRSFGYQLSSDNQNTYIRSRSITLQYEGDDRSNTLNITKSAEDINLPETIDNSVFNTIHTMTQFVRDYNLGRFISIGRGRLKNDINRNFREFLNEQGYAVDSKGNFIRRGGLLISGGFEFNDLITVNEYVTMIKNPEKIVIDQTDLVRLNVTLNDFLTKISKTHWHTFDDFVQEASSTLGVSSPIVSLAVILIKLPQENNQVYITILKTLNDSHPYRRMDERLNAIYNYLRQRLQIVPKNYQKRESFNGPALTTMSLQEAIMEGYEIEEDQFSDQINELLNWNSVPTIHRKALVEFIQRYPDTFGVIREYGNKKRSFTHVLIRLYYPEIPGYVQELYTYAVNYPLMFAEAPEKTARRQQIAALPRSYLDSLYQMYSSRDIEVILDMPQNPLELYLTAISKVKADQLPSLAANFGMLIPEHLLKRNIRRYILQFIDKYRAIISRPENTPLISQVINGQPNNVVDFIKILNRYTDQEIATHFGYIGGFENRNALIEQIYQNISEEGFMIYKEIDLNAATNVETTWFMPIKDIPGPYIVFGTPFSYRVLELDEFISAFYEERKPNQEIIGFKFTKIGTATKETYTIRQVSRLQSLLPIMKNMNPQFITVIDQILEKIRSGIIRTMKRNAEVDALIRDIKRAPPAVQNIIRDIFYKIFYAGMYMRKWKGPGNRYPMADVSTRKGNNPEPKSIAILAEIIELMIQLENLDKDLYQHLQTIPEIDYRTIGDEIEIKSHTLLFDRISIIAQGEECIRQASRPLVISASYYISVIFGEVIPDFDPHSVDPIS